MMLNKKPRWLLVLGLILALQLSASPAHAQLVVTDPIMDGITAANHIVNTILSSLKSQIDNLRARIALYYQTQIAQAQIDQAQKQAMAQLNAKINNDAFIPDASGTCATILSKAASDALDDANTSSAYAQQALSGSRGIMGGADATAPSASTKRFIARVQAGFISDNGRYGTTGSSPITKIPGHRTLSSPQDIYIDADMKISSVLNPAHTPNAKVDPGALEYSLPKTFGVDKNGYVTFSDSSGANSATDDQLAFEAAYMFCDSLLPPSATPTHGDHLTVDDIVNITDDRMNTANRTAAADRCFAALRYRTACPSSTSSSFKSSDGTTCHEIQLAMCNFMKKPAPDGLGMDATRPSLANCDANGLSAAEYDRLLATRCHDKSYVATIYADLDAQTAEHFMLYECPMLEMTYQMKMDQQRTALEQAVLSLTLARNNGSRPDVTARPVGTGATGP